MANLKLDLLNKLRNDKYYEEIELVRLAGDPNMNYKEKIEAISYRLERIAISDIQVSLVERYFVEPVQQPISNQPIGQPIGQPHPGQTHAE